MIVVFEFDVPGHSSSWGRGYPNISSHCPGLGVMNPAREDAYDAIDKVLEYVSSVNPEKYFMVGGDEIDLNCWKNDPTVVKFMEDKGYKTMDEVLAYFETRVIALVAKHGLSVNCWQGMSS
jgi:hexosaminidase